MKLICGFLVFLLFTSTSLSFAAVSRPHLITEAGAASAGTCMDCQVRAPQSALSAYLAQLPVVQDGFARVHNAAIFDTDERQAVSDLRLREERGQRLTAEQQAILRASAQTGSIGCTISEGRTASSNATLIQIPDGQGGMQDAVITTAHAFLDDNGQPRCDLRHLRYFMNFNFHIDDGRAHSPFTRDFVLTDGQLPINLNAVLGPNRINDRNDFLIFPLSRTISEDQLPNGTTRGFMRIDPQPPTAGTTYLIGRNQNFRNWNSSSYESCEYVVDRIALHHVCSTTQTSSSSAMTRLVNGEMVLIGIHSGEIRGPAQRTRPSQITQGGNVAVPIQSVVEALRPRARTQTK